MKSSIARRLTAVAGVGAMATALALAGVGTAVAKDKGGQGQCAPLQLKFSTDGGSTWITDGTLTAAPTSVKVKLTGSVTAGCVYPVSLAAYKTHGPTWETSGKQVFLAVTQTILSGDERQATLKVKGVKKSTCFGQIDLYGSNKVYDGKSGALPHYPNSVTPKNLIANWNGAFKGCEGGGETPPPSNPPSGSPSDSATPSDSPTDSPAPSDSPTPTGSPTGTPSGGASPSPSASASSGAPAPVDTAAPSGTPVAQPESSTPALADTGSDSTQTTAFIAAGAALVVGGAGTVVLARRRNRTHA